MASALTKLSLLLVLVAMAEASIYRTTITTTEYEGKSRECHEQISVEPLMECSSRDDCCRILGKMREPCRCPALRQVARELVEREGLDEEQVRRMVKTYLGECDLEPYCCKFREY